MSVNSFELSAIVPSSRIVHSINVSIPRLRLLAVSLSSPLCASRRIHSNIGLTVLVATAFDTVLSPANNVCFLHLILIFENAPFGFHLTINI